MGGRCLRAKAEIGEKTEICELREMQEPKKLLKVDRNSMEGTLIAVEIEQAIIMRWREGNRLGCPLEGIQNKGNTCFAGAALMALLSNPAFVETLERQKESETSELSRALLTLETDKSQVSTVLAFFREFNDGLQHCAHNFLTHIFMQLGGKRFLSPEDRSGPELLTYCRSNRNSDFFDMHAVVIQTKFSCVKCVLKGISEPMVTGTMMWSLSVPVRKALGVGNRSWCQASEYVADKAEYWQRLKLLYESEDSQSCTEDTSLESSLESSLKLALGTSLLPSNSLLSCSKCQTDTLHFRQQELVHTGSHLIIHLQRYDPSTTEKDSSFVSIPMSLDLSQFNHSLDKYALYAVICHEGGLKGGHYWVNLRRKGRWYMYDDHIHTCISETQALDKTAYVLFYKRIAEKPRSQKDF